MFETETISEVKGRFAIALLKFAISAQDALTDFNGLIVFEPIYAAGLNFGSVTPSPLSSKTVSTAMPIFT